MDKENKIKETGEELRALVNLILQEHSSLADNDYIDPVEDRLINSLIAGEIDNDNIRDAIRQHTNYGMILATGAIDLDNTYNIVKI